MKCKIFGLVFATHLVLLNSANTKAERLGKVKFLRPLRRQWSHDQSNGRSERSGTGRGLLKHFLTLRNMWQQPLSNVIVITRPTTTQNDDTTTTTAGTTRMNSEKSEHEISHNDDETEILAVNKPFKLNNGVNDKISMNAMHDYSSKGSSNRKRNKKRRNSLNHNTKRRKQITDVESFTKAEKDHRSGNEGNIKWKRNGEIRQTEIVEPTFIPPVNGNYIRRLINSFRLQPVVLN